MSQININTNEPGRAYDEAPADQVNVTPGAAVRSTDGGARAAATNNLTWAIALVLVIAAIAIAAVVVLHSI